MRKMRALAIVLSVILSGGCAAYRPAPLAPLNKAREFEARTLDDTGLKGFLESNLGRKINPWPQRLWDFPLLTLVSFYYHPDLDVVRARWEVAKAGIITAGERPNPTVGFSPQYNTTTTTPSPWILNFVLDVPVETAGKRGYRIAQAQHLSEAARLNMAGTAWRVRSRLRAGLLDFFSAVQTEGLLKSQQEIQQQVIKAMEKRLKFGEVSEPDVTRTRIAFDQTRLALLQLQVQVAEALGAIGRCPWPA